MTKLYLKYNPYTVQSEIEINGNPVQAPNKLFDLKNERLQVWLEDLIPLLDESCNDDEYDIEFYGTRLDYCDLQSCIDDYITKHTDIKVNVNFKEAKGSEDRFNELISLFEDMQKNCPFEDLTTEQIKENFNNAVSSEFEVSVIATMSSGKSTLINSLLGRELMPSRNEACTATIARIKDIDEQEVFTAEYRDSANNVLGNFNSLTLEAMNEMNDNLNTAYINIEGNIPHIDSKGIQLVLIDTPGPNNSRTEEHKNHTYRIIKEKTKPMVLYVLNATQLQTTDDDILLSVVAEAMKVGGKQSKDRFIFAINKIDQFDPDKESVHEAINNVITYLNKHGIEKPNIFPTSAEMAKVIRMNQNRQELTTKQKKTLRDYDLFIEDENLHLSEQASLSNYNKIKVNQMIEQARNAGDGYQEALVYTGIPAIELAINEYLRKYAYTTKVKTAVDTFIKKVEEKCMLRKMLESIQNDETARIKINEQLKAIGRQLTDGKSANEFKNKIQNLNMTHEAEKRIKNLRTKISRTIVNEDNRSSMSTLEVQQLMMKLQRNVRDLQSDVKTELESIINDVIVNNAQNIMNEYKKHMHSLITSGDLNTGDYATSSSISFLEEDMPDAQDIINQYKYQETVDTGDKEWIENTNKKWYKPWTWFQEAGHYKTIYTNVEMVNYGTVYDDFIQPIIANFNDNLEAAKETANQEANDFKIYFIDQLNKLEEVMKKKVVENEKLTRNQIEIEQKMRKDEQKIEWLKNFMNKLDVILTI